MIPTSIMTFIMKYSRMFFGNASILCLSKFFCGSSDASFESSSQSTSEKQEMRIMRQVKRAPIIRLSMNAAIIEHCMKFTSPTRSAQIAVAHAGPISC